MADDLVECLVAAVRGLKLWDKFGSMAEVGAFALCTDSSLSNLLACAAPIKWLDENEEMTFWPPDWPLEDDGDPILAPPGELLGKRYRAARAQAPGSGLQEISDHISQSFAHFVEALEHLRQEKFFAAKTILLVCGTTPDARMFPMSTDAVVRLNGEDVVARWRAS